MARTTRIARRARHGWIPLLLVAFTAGAAEDEERVHLQYERSGPCAGRDAFVAQVAARTPKARWATSPEGVRVFQVTLAADPEEGERWSQAAGTLTILDTDGSRATRRVEGDSCEEVLAAVALIAALAIDPQADVLGAVVAPPPTPPMWEPPAPLPPTPIPPPPPPVAPP
ncbi:MAG: hypothetical protein JRI23_30235, partial [Deltaproteobacteria bacterium]|nr:hypothetical protein [Deltaproteobacteria bacterium]MBW2536448.1 hypothetical protein [Deltaproteobacteria bacterium]